MRKIETGTIASNVQAFLRSDVNRPDHLRRERSWDLCFSYFRDHPAPTQSMETSCLHLGYYLASWGMLRGSSFLFRETNLLHYRRAVEVIERYNGDMRAWDVPQYLDGRRRSTFEAAWADLYTALLPNGGASLTLVSKTMMGVWGCIPSFETFFRRTFKALSESPSEEKRWGRVRADTLSSRHEVYRNHEKEIEGIRERFPVWTFEDTAHSQVKMPVAKVLDIYGFYESWKSA